MTSAAFDKFRPFFQAEWIRSPQAPAKLAAFCRDAELAGCHEIPDVDVLVGRQPAWVERSRLTARLAKLEPAMVGVVKGNLSQRGPVLEASGFLASVP